MNSKLRELLAEEMGVSPELIMPESRLIDDLGMDSLDRLEVALLFEEEFDLDISDEELAAWETVADLEKMLKEAPGHD